MLQKIQSGSCSRSLSLVLMLVATIMGSFGGLGIKSVSWDPLAINGVRSVFGAIAMLAITRRVARPGFKWKRDLGAVAYAATLTLFVAATKLTTAANASLLLNTSPIYVALLGWLFLKQRPSAGEWITLAAVIAGMALFFADRISFQGGLGNMLAMVGAVSLAIVGLCMQEQRSDDNLQTLLLGNLLVAVLSIPWIITAPITVPSLAIVAILGILQLGAADILYAIAIRNVSALEAKLMYSLKPVLNAVWVIIFLGEWPGRWAAVGGLLVLGVITGRGVFVVRHPKPLPRNSANESEDTPTV